MARTHKIQNRRNYLADYTSCGKRVRDILDGSDKWEDVTCERCLKWKRGNKKK